MSNELSSALLLTPYSYISSVKVTAMAQIRKVMGRPLLDFKSVESARDHSQQPQIFQCSSRLSRSSPSFLFSRIISQGSARNSIFSQRSYPGLGRTREGNSIGALFYKYLSSFESPSGTEDLFTPCHCLPSSHSVFFAPSPFPRPKSPFPHPRVFVLANLLYVPYADLHL